MNFLGTLDRLRTLLREGGSSRPTYYGATYHGYYEPQGNFIVGTVADDVGSLANPPAAVVVMRDGEVAVSTNEFRREGNIWRFRLEVERPFTPDEVMRETLAVFAVDRHGGRSKMAMEGALQLSFIREATAPPSETELIIDFSSAGNSAEYRIDGWHGQEPDHVWTDGKSSTIALPYRQPGERYHVEIFAWPFVVEGKLPDQTLIVSLGEVELAKFYARVGANLLEFDIPPEVTSLNQHIFDLRHPDAVRACDLIPGKEARMLALAFRRIKLKRLLQTEQAAGDRGVDH